MGHGIFYAVECGYVTDLYRYGRKIFQNASTASSRLPISRASRIRDSDGAPTSTVHRRWHRYRIAHQSQGETLKTPALIRTHPSARTRAHIADQQVNDSVRPVPGARERLLSGKPVRPPNAVEANSSLRRRALRARGTQPPGIGVKQANESRSRRKSGLRRSHPCG